MDTAFSDIVSVSPNGIRLTVRAKPGLKRTRPPKIVDRGDGKRALEITVKEAATDGKANQAIIAQLAALLDMRKQDIEITSGASGRLKVIALNGNTSELTQKTTDWLRQLDARLL